MKRIILLGATGSIGRSACDVVRAHPERFKVVALAVRENLAAAALLGREFGAKVYSGETGAVRAVEENDADLVLVATVGLSGLSPTLTALGKGMTVALATKEVLVAAGELVTAAAAAAGRPIIPVDSEHSAIFQCLQGSDAARSVSRLILTASGGPFLDAPRDLDGVTPEQALNHPRWDMGPKVTIDSATMMNKGFEIIEAFWLFGLPVERIDVVVHPESIVHSLVEFSDGATLAQLAPPDMRVPIQYAFTWPERLPAARAPLDLVALGALTFRAPDEAARLVLSDGWRYNFVYLLRDSFLFEDHYDATLWCLQQLFLSSLVCRLLGCLPERLSPLTRAGIAVGIGVLLLLFSPAYCVWISVSLLGCLLRLALSEADRLPALTKPPVLIGLFAAAVLCIKAPLEEGLTLYLLEGLGAFLLLWVLFRTAWARRLLGRGPFPRLGLWSMGLFVVHTPVFSLVDSSLYVLLDGRLPLWAALPVTFAVGLTLCVLASRLLHAAYGALSRRFGRERVNA